MTTTQTIQILTGHCTQETAHIIDGYPYGFKLKCKKAFWIESPTKGAGKGRERLVTATTNPKYKSDGQDVWNKPKAGQYALFIILYIDPETGYVEDAPFKGRKAKEYLAQWGEYLTDRQLGIVRDYCLIDDMISRKFDEVGL